MIFRPSGRVHDSQNQFRLILDPPNSLKLFKKHTIVICETCYVGKSKHLRNQKIENIGKRGPEYPEVPPIIFWKA